MDSAVLYADYVSPFCYLAEVVLDTLGAEAASIERRPFELWPAEAGAEGTPAAGEWDVARAIAQTLGVPLTLPTRLPRTRKAHEAAEFARERGRFDALHRAIYRAFHVHGRDIGRVDVLAELAGSNELDALEARIALDIDRYTDAVIEREREAIAAGVTAVPMLVRDGSVLAGLQPAGALRAFLRGAHLDEKGAVE